MIMRPANWLVFNGKALSDFGVYISGNGTFSSAARDYEVIGVPGRTGDLLHDNGRYRNTQVSYPAWIAEDMDDNMKNLRAFLGSSLGYCRLEDTYHPDEYRLAAYTEELQPSVALLAFSQFTLTFNCKPQRYLKSGEIPKTFTANGAILNPTSFKSKPLIKVYGTGSFKVGNYTITISSNSFSYIIIDSELMDCYSPNNENANPFVSLPNGFPELNQNGDTTITRTDSTITEIEITPRWWTL